jgi:sarcosine oxidase delta subunit
MSSRRTLKSVSLVTKTAELAFAVPQVVAHRVTRMALAGPSLSERDRREFHLMGAEKAHAFSEAWDAMTMQAFVANQALAASLLRSFWTHLPGCRPFTPSMTAQLHSAALGIMGKGLAPVHRTAVANAKRLARTKLR